MCSFEDMIADRQTHTHTQTDRQTDRHTHHDTRLPYRGRVYVVAQYAVLEANATVGILIRTLAKVALTAV